MEILYMMTKTFQLPREIAIGKHVYGEIPNIWNNLHLGQRAGIVVSNTSKRVAGNDIEKILQRVGHSVTMIETNNSDIDSLDTVNNIVNDVGIDYLVGIGGGKIIDVSKLSAYQNQIPFISIPTIAAHDGIVSSRASIIEDGKNVSYTVDTPVAMLANTNIIASAPSRYLIAGCGDIMSNRTAILDWKMANRLHNEKISNSAIAISEMSSQTIEESADSINPMMESSVKLVIKSLVSSSLSMCIAGTSCPASGSEHMFSHALDQIAEKRALHGEQCAMGSILSMYFHGKDWQSHKKILEKIGVPVTLSDIGLNREDVINALMIAHTIKPERHTIFDVGITEEVAEKAIRITKIDK